MELHLSRRHRIRLVVEGALVGVVVGLVIAAYRFMLSHAEVLLRLVTSELARRGAWYALWFVVLGLICFVVSLLMTREPYTQASGIPQIDAEVAGHIDMPWKRVVPIKFAEGVLCAFAGLSLGREGPSVLLGGMAGKGVSRLLGRKRSHERLLITCGAASGMAAAFHAPLTGVLFALEEIHKEFSASLVISVMTSTIAADFISSHLLGIKPLIHFVVYDSIPHELYLAVLGMGVFCGILGWAHNAGMFVIQDRLFGPFEQHAPWRRLIVPFMLAGVVALLWPDLTCGGDAIIERVMDIHNETFLTLLALLVGKYVFTAICFGSGAPGGTLFPLVVLGTLVGALYGMVVTQFTPVPGYFINSFIVLGIAGMFASVIQAPVTAVVMVFELTGSMEALLATSVVSIVAYVTATMLKTDAYYEHLLNRMLGKSSSQDDEERTPRGSKVICNYVVGAGSSLENQLVREVTWPDDVLVISVRQAGKKLIPKGDTRISALSEISVLMDEADEPAVNEVLTQMCASKD